MSERDNPLIRSIAEAAVDALVGEEQTKGVVSFFQDDNRWWRKYEAETKGAARALVYDAVEKALAKAVSEYVKSTVEQRDAALAAAGFLPPSSLSLGAALHRAESEPG